MHYKPFIIPRVFSLPTFSGRLTSSRSVAPTHDTTTINPRLHDTMRLAAVSEGKEARDNSHWRRCRFIAFQHDASMVHETASVSLDDAVLLLISVCICCWAHVDVRHTPTHAPISLSSSSSSSTLLAKSPWRPKQNQYKWQLVWTSHGIRHNWNWAAARDSTWNQRPGV